MNKEILKIDDVEIEKCEFRNSKDPNQVKYVNVISNKVSFGKRSFNNSKET